MCADRSIGTLRGPGSVSMDRESAGGWQMTSVEYVLARLSRVQPSHGGWTAECPAHEDQTPSLSVAEGAGGRVLVHCHVGCTAEAICQAVGWTSA